ncbi:hypothetical protein MABM_03190 [Mycobacteroides abscessus]|nr:hypothetical protein MABM_03190 [Mycobacteroides abscessus]
MAACDRDGIAAGSDDGCGCVLRSHRSGVHAGHRWIGRGSLRLCHARNTEPRERRACAGRTGGSVTAGAD